MKRWWMPHGYVAYRNLTPGDRWRIREMAGLTGISKARVGFWWNWAFLVLFSLLWLTTLAPSQPWLLAGFVVLLFVMAVFDSWWYWIKCLEKIRPALREAGFCLYCGYNLEANTSGICPECGVPAPRKG